MKNRRNYYRILHVQRDAPTEVIRSTYRTMMQKLRMHPDLGGDHANAAWVNEAFAVLSDPELRAEYDASLDAEGGANPGSARDSAQPQDSEDASPPPGDEQCLFCLARCQPAQFRGPDDVCSNCRSPVYPAEQRRFEVDCQRAIGRIPQRAPASYSANWPDVAEHSGWVHDISLSGMQLRTNDELSDGDIVRVSMDVLDAVAQVIDIRQLAVEQEAAWRVGLVFLTMKLHHSRGSFVSMDV